jgi:predicted nucleotidyltransferase
MAVLESVIADRARKAIEVVSRRTRVRRAYLFGSHVTGAAGEFSDIDIAAFIDDAQALGLKGRVGLAVEARELAGDDIELHFFPAEFLDRPPAASFAAYILRHGVRIL